MADPIRRLPDAELTVMQAVWACPTPVYRTDLEEALRASHPMAPTTLLTLLSRLAEKGFLAVEKEGRRSRYAPKVSREDYLAAQGRSFFQKLCGGDLSAFAAALCGSGLSQEELDELRELLERGRL